MNKGSAARKAELSDPLGEKSGDDALEQFIGYKMKRVLSLVWDDLKGVLDTFNLRVVEFSALTVIVAHPGIRQMELAKMLDIERSNLVAIVDAMEAQGLITRNAIAGDRRAHALKATPKGSRLAEKTSDAVRQHENRVFGLLDVPERAALDVALGKLRDSLRRDS